MLEYFLLADHVYRYYVILMQKAFCFGIYLLNKKTYNETSKLTFLSEFAVHLFAVSLK